MLNNLNVTGKTRSRDQCEEDNLTVTRNRSSIDFYLVFVVQDFFVSPVIRNFFQNDLEPDPLFLLFIHSCHSSNHVGSRMLWLRDMTS